MIKKYHYLIDRTPVEGEEVKLLHRPRPYEGYTEIGMYTYMGKTGSQFKFKADPWTKKPSEPSFLFIPTDQCSNYQYLVIPKLNWLQKIFGSNYLGVFLLLLMMYMVFKVFFG